MAVHPRVCGERLAQMILAAQKAGSSPRVRGTPRIVLTLHGPQRFIPACAGNAPPLRRASPSHAVHPRVCGERACPEVDQGVAIGSSPRVRGTRRPHLPVPVRPRFIPACAGNAALSGPACGRDPVHPRVCGERSAGRALPKHTCGSSPRVRGTRRRYGHARVFVRFIPACAGNAPPRAGLWARRPVHPRVCGERPADVRGERIGDGSSPRVRGTRLIAHDAVQVHRFIPACAGNAAPAAEDAPPRPVHPRVCGERFAAELARPPIIGSSPRVRGTHFARFRPISPPPGSSPRVRGTHAPPRAQRFAFRFIPACAGNASRELCSHSCLSVHPRVCGERRLRFNEALRPAGSSPRVRGTPASGCA